MAVSKPIFSNADAVSEASSALLKDAASLCEEKLHGHDIVQLSMEFHCRKNFTAIITATDVDLSGWTDTLRRNLKRNTRSKFSLDPAVGSSSILILHVFVCFVNICFCNFAYVETPKIW